MVKTSDLLVAFFVLQSMALFGQLDTIHWCPPMHARNESGPQYLFLSTPELTPFTVSIRDGAGNLVTTAIISNSQPFQFLIGTDDNTQTLIKAEKLQKPLTGKGLIINGSKPFYATFRAHSDNKQHAGDLTCKGRDALGKVFRIGHLVQSKTDGFNRSNFIGIMATEDNTVIQLSGFDPSTKFQMGTTDTELLEPVSMTLNQGQSLVFSQYIGSDAKYQPPNGLMGALLESSKPVVVNTGSWVGAPANFPGHDIGIDQIVPIEKVGKEYVLCKGNGSAILEHPIVVAHSNNTKVFINGSNTPATVLQGGDYYVVPTERFSTAGNMYIQTSEPVYLYQMIGGENKDDNQYRTAGLNFVPPLSCNISNSVDNIYLPNRIGDFFFAGGVMIVAMRDSQIIVRLNGSVVSIGSPDDVPGNADFVTYRNLDLFSEMDTVKTISVVSGGSIQVALFGHNKAAGFAGFFSGFTKNKQANVKLSLLGDGTCPDTLLATGHFDQLQWQFEGSIISTGTDTLIPVFAPGNYQVFAFLGACQDTDTATDSITVNLNSTAFPYAIKEPSCFGFSNGEVLFGTPQGGLGEYVYSVDNGEYFSIHPLITGLSAGTYKLIVKDSIGCYNKPLTIEIGQPDSFAVHLKALEGANEHEPGHLASFMAVPEHPIIQTEWAPSDSSDCPDCLFYSFNPEESTWVTVTVYDSIGCSATDKRLIEITQTIYAPNAIRPYSIELNDVFSLFSKQDLRVHQLIIYDRWGEAVFENRNFLTNDPSAGWDGRFRGEAMQPGVFVWMAEVVLNTGKTELISGDFTLFR